MDIIFALILAVIGMLVVMGFLFILVILLNGLRIVNTFKEKMADKRKISSAPRTKVAAHADEGAPQEEASGGKADDDGAEAAALEDEDEEVRQLLAAAVSAYLLLKEKEARKAGDKRRKRNVWSIAGKYEILSQRMTGGEGHNF